MPSIPWQQSADEWIKAQPRMSSDELYRRYRVEAANYGWVERSPEAVNGRWRKLTQQQRRRGVPQAVRCTQSGQVWDTLADAAQHFGVTAMAISRGLQRKGQWRTLKRHHLRTPKPRNTPSSKSHSGKRPQQFQPPQAVQCHRTGTVWPSLVAAAAAHDIPRQSLGKALHRQGRWQTLRLVTDDAPAIPRRTDAYLQAIDAATPRVIYHYEMGGSGPFKTSRLVQIAVNLGLSPKLVCEVLELEGMLPLCAWERLPEDKKERIRAVVYDAQLGGRSA